jgi:hypothetical protein
MINPGLSTLFSGAGRSEQGAKTAYPVVPVERCATACAAASFLRISTGGCSDEMAAANALSCTGAGEMHMV